MSEHTHILDTEEAWEEGKLGRDDAFVQTGDVAVDEAIDDAIGLQPISIRLERSLIEDFKMIAQLHGLGYQPLMRQALKRFAECEKKRLLRELVAQRAEDIAQQQAATEPESAPRRGHTKQKKAA